MKRNIFVIGLMVLLLLSYGAIYLFTVKQQAKLNALDKEIDSLTFEQEALRKQFFLYSSLERINEIAVKKFGMVPPKTFYIIELNSGQ